MLIVVKGEEATSHKDEGTQRQARLIGLKDALNLETAKVQTLLISHQPRIPQTITLIPHHKQGGPTALTTEPHKTTLTVSITLNPTLLATETINIRHHSKIQTLRVPIPSDIGRAFGKVASFGLDHKRKGERVGGIQEGVGANEGVVGRGQETEG